MTKNRDISNILDQNTTFTATVSVGSGTGNVFANSTVVKVANSTVNTYLRVPTTTEYAGNYYLHANGTWQLVSAGATPGGSNTYVQFNDSTALGGTAGFTFDKATNNAIIANTLTVGTATINSTNYSQTANNALNLGGTAAAGYQTTAGLSANVATLTANNATWHGTSVFANSTGAYPTSNSVGAVLGNTISRVIITGNSATFISTLAAADTTVTGFVNATTVVNSAAHTIGTTLIANTLGVYHTGIMNAASFTTTGFLANTTVVVPASNSSGQTLGNTISRWVITGNSATFSSTLAATDTTITGFVNATVSVNSSAHTIGTTFIANTLGVYHTGTMNAASFTTTGFLANATHVVPTSNSSGQTFGNTISRWVMTANSLTVSGGASPDSNTLGTALGTNTQRWILIANSADIGPNFVANTLGAYHTATINAASFTTTGFLANTTGVFPASNTVGQNFGNTIARWVITGNSATFISTLAAGDTTITGFVNATVSVNSAAHTIGATLIANTLGVYHTGTVNAASFTTTGFLANATHVVPTSNSSGQTLGNTISRWVITANSLTISGALNANGTVGTNGQALISNGTIPYWGTVTASAAAGGSNTQVQFNDSTAIGGSAGFTFDKTANNVFYANTLTSGNSTVNSVSNSTTILLSNSTTETISANSAALAIGNSTVNNTLNSVCIAINVSPTANLTSNTVIVQLANASGTSNLTPVSLAIATSLLANSLGLYPGSNTVGNLFGNTISRWDAYLDTVDVGAGVIGNSIGIYPASNTVGMNFGNTLSRWIITANSVTTTGLLANSLGLYPTSNTVGQLLGNTISRWTPTFIGQSANSLGFYPVSNTVGNLLGNTISRFDILASTIGASGVTTLAGQVANSLGFYPTSNTVGQLFGNTISRFDITANSITTSGNIELGAATDTTLSRSAAGALDVEGHTVVFDDVENQAISGGGTITEKDLGIVAAAGTVTLDMGDRPHQKYNANGAHTLAPGAVIGSCLVIITNGTSAGAMTTSGWTKVAGDAYTTTSANKFVCHASVSAAGSLLIIQAMQ